ncbi:TIGR01244 family sulfur transferase [Stenoxybacter acetivorans]|uniref:TIGR01244 family sulfur transferase n=1 Tax=Stenoxybacter acetivorans TaxID=422441 RepID=UPI00056B2798|nr:TIGR01244 family sulfur transferase [Stenoxybacter acetivorans]
MDQLAKYFFCAPQISLTDIQAAKALDIDAVVCQRPDFEEPNQPTGEEVKQWCQDAGMAFVFLPVIPGQITVKDVKQFDELTRGYQTLLGYCRTGTRASILWAANEVAHGNLTADEAQQIIADSGRDIGAAINLLKNLEKK